MGDPRPHSASPDATPAEAFADERAAFAPYSAFDIPEDLRELHGRYDVEATARRVRNFRYAEEWTMMTLAGWIATLPELPVKTGLGKIVWETAQAADALGRRLPELRCGRRALARSEPDNAGFAAFLRAVAEPERPEHTVEKLTGVFEVVKPHLAALYEEHVRETDPISDAPTVEILEDVLRRTRAHVAWGREVLDRLCDTDALVARRERRVADLHALLVACGGATGTLPGA